MSQPYLQIAVFTVLVTSLAMPAEAQYYGSSGARSGGTTTYVRPTPPQSPRYPSAGNPTYPSYNSNNSVDVLGRDGTVKSRGTVDSGGRVRDSQNGRYIGTIRR